MRRWVALGTVLGLAACSRDPVAPPIDSESAVPAASLAAAGITDLGTLGGTYSAGFGINDAGVVVGASRLSDGSLAGFRWTASTGMTMLTSLGGAWTFALDINNRGDIVGCAVGTDNILHPVVWHEDGTVTDVGQLPGGAWGCASGINERGEVTGGSEVNSSTLVSHAFRWTASGGMVDLGTLYSGTISDGQEINARGDIAGFNFTSIGYTLPFQFTTAFWPRAGGEVTMGTLGGDQSVLWGLNDLGEMAGFSSLPTGELRAIRIDAAGALTDLGTLAGGTWATAQAISNRHEIVGQSEDAAGSSKPVVWRADGTIEELLTLGGPSGVAYALNERGQATGEAETASGAIHAVLWSGGSAAVAAAAPAGSAGRDPAAEPSRPRRLSSPFSLGWREMREVLRRRW